MRSKYFGEQNQASIFIDHIDSLPNDQDKIRLLRKRVLDLERANRRLKFSLGHGRSAKRGEIAFEKPEAKSTKGKDFYNSLSWKRLRYQFLMLSENKECKNCGSSKNLQVDHIVPRSIDPSRSLDQTNLQILCADCNFGKGATPDHVLRKRR